MKKSKNNKNIKNKKTGGRKNNKTIKKIQLGGSEFPSYINSNIQQSQPQPQESQIKSLSNVGGKPSLGKRFRNGISNLFGIIKNKLSRKLFSNIQQQGGRKIKKTLKRKLKK